MTVIQFPGQLSDSGNELFPNLPFPRTDEPMLGVIRAFVTDEINKAVANKTFTPDWVEHDLVVRAMVVAWAEGNLAATGDNHLRPHGPLMPMTMFMSLNGVGDPYRARWVADQKPNTRGWVKLDPENYITMDGEWLVHRQGDYWHHAQYVADDLGEYRLNGEASVSRGSARKAMEIVGERRRTDGEN